jgi:hypothetical protein
MMKRSFKEVQNGFLIKNATVYPRSSSPFILFRKMVHYKYFFAICHTYPASHGLLIVTD